ncbi:hypothetical protein B0H14DRAFT_2556634 [Mycena olivaceomarginata]|nr:hypothetical protein B0H14DRAFT_2556634 [Mycena olivaceomarginata]
MECMVELVEFPLWVPWWNIHRINPHSWNPPWKTQEPALHVFLINLEPDRSSAIHMKCKCTVSTLSEAQDPECKCFDTCRNGWLGVAVGEGPEGRRQKRMTMSFSNNYGGNSRITSSNCGKAKKLNEYSTSYALWKLFRNGVAVADSIRSSDEDQETARGETWESLNRSSATKVKATYPSGSPCLPGSTRPLSGAHGNPNPERKIGDTIRNSERADPGGACNAQVHRLCYAIRRPTRGAKSEQEGQIYHILVDKLRVLDRGDGEPFVAAILTIPTVGDRNSSPVTPTKRARDDATDAAFDSFGSVSYVIQRISFPVRK